MIYEKALKQFNSTFHLSIKPPSKLSPTCSNIKLIQCQYMSSNDFTLLANIQNAQKPLQKLQKLISTFQQIINQNEKIRKQNSIRSVDYRVVKDMEYLFAECKQIGSSQQFINFIHEKGDKLCDGGVTNQLSIKNDKQINICKEIEFYNNISQISDEQYFKQLEQLNENLQLLRQNIISSFKNKEVLISFNEKLKEDQLFNSKDNRFNKVINYNLRKNKQMISEIEEVKKITYQHRENLTFSLARIYYILNLSQQQIQQNKTNFSQLQEIKKFLTEKPQRIFIKLYTNTVNESLLKLQQIRYNFINTLFDTPKLSIDQKQKITNKITTIQNQIKNHENRNDDQLFLQEVFQQIQNLLIKIQGEVALSGDEVMKKGKQLVLKCEDQCVRLLKIENSRVNGSWRKSNASSGSRYDKNKKNQILDTIIEIQAKSEIFDYSKIKKQSKNTQLQTKLKDNHKFYEQSCKAYLNKIQPNFGQSLQDNKNFQPEQLNILIQQAPHPTPKLTQLLRQIYQNIIKPQIKETTLYKIFSPILRFKQLKKFHQLLINSNQKIQQTKNKPLYPNFPENIKKFIKLRNTFLTIVIEQINKIIDIAQQIDQIKIKKQYDVCSHQSYQSLLKTLKAYKQVISYHSSFKDQKKISNGTYIFINKKIYEPFQQVLRYRHPQLYTDVKQLEEVVEELQLFQKLIPETKQLTDRFIMRIQNQINKVSLQNSCEQLIGNLKIKIEEYQNYLHYRQLFNYEQAEKQLAKLSEIIKACQYVKKQELKDLTAIKIARILQKKI